MNKTIFNKVLVVEDIDSINIAVTETLKSFEIANIEYVKYCDEAFSIFKNANENGQPFDLIVTDLSFLDDQTDINLKSGEDLIEAVRNLQPSIKIIVYSIEDKSYRIQSLFENHKINSFVHKSRISIEELKTAIQLLSSNGKRFYSPAIISILEEEPMQEITTYDVKLLTLLANGIPQDKIDVNFQEMGVKPNSKSSIEKRINKLKLFFKANNTIHLIAIAKDMGIL